MNEAEIEYLKQIIKVEKVAYIRTNHEFRPVAKIITSLPDNPAAVFEDGDFLGLKYCHLGNFITYSRMEPIQ